MKVFSIPYVFRDRDHYWRFLQSERGRELLLSLRRVRLRGLPTKPVGAAPWPRWHAPGNRAEGRRSYKEGGTTQTCGCGLLAAIPVHTQLSLFRDSIKPGKHWLAHEYYV